MSLMSLHQTLTPRDIAMWTARIYSRNWQQWLLLGFLAVAPVFLLAVAISLFWAPASTEVLFTEELMAALEGTGTITDAQLQDATRALMDYALPTLLQQLLQIFSQLILFGVLASGPGAMMASAAYHNRAVTIGDAVDVLRQRGALLFTAYATIAGIMIALLAGSFLGTFFCVGFLGFGTLVYVYLAAVPMMGPAIALEQGTLNARMRTAWQLGKVRVWLIFGAVITIYVARFVLLLVMALLQALVGIDSAVVSIGLGMLVQALMLPFEVIFFTLLFEDTRDRLAAMTTKDDLGLPSLDGAPPPSHNVVTSLPLLTAADLPNIVSVTMASFGLFFLMYIGLMIMQFLPF